MGLVKFVSCTREQYENLISKDEDTIYFVEIGEEDGTNDQDVEGNNENSERIERIEP